MPKPGFLIIGAMKAGTTTLYEDLRGVPGLYMPPEKEPEDLIHPAAETPEGQARYFARFDAAPQGALCGEASTAYTKRPTYDGVAARARAVLGPELRLIYLTRDPIKRAVSQHQHNWGLGLERRPLAEAIRTDHSYVDYSRYDWQLAPWRATFGEGALLVLRFEDYLADRAGTLAQICAFLGVDAPALAPEDTHRNKSDGKRYVPRGGVLERVMQSRLYQYTLKPLMSSAMRDRIKALILPQAQAAEGALDAALRAEMREALEGDALAARYFD